MAQRGIQSIEFVVKPREDLFLEGSIRTLPRVLKNEQYPCQMQKNQTFSCLFRHYAKHNGLRKEDLVFYFVDELLPDEMPETVHLMQYDEIWVEHRKPTTMKSPAENICQLYFDQLRTCLLNGDHADVTFIFGSSKEEIVAHKAILSARSEYFRAMFRRGGLAESTENVVEVSIHSIVTFKRMLEFIYTQHILELDTCPVLEVVKLMMLANEYLLDDLKKMCETVAAKNISDDNVGKMTLLCEKVSASELREACRTYVLKNLATLRENVIFRQSVTESPELALLLMDALPEHAIKKRRLDNGDGSSGNGGIDSATSNSFTIRNGTNDFLNLNTGAQHSNIQSEDLSSTNTIWPHENNDVW